MELLTIYVLGLNLAASYVKKNPFSTLEGIVNFVIVAWFSREVFPRMTLTSNEVDLVCSSHFIKIMCFSTWKITSDRWCYEPVRLVIDN